MPGSGAASPFVVALVQRPPVFLNLQATLERAVDAVAGAAGQGAAVVVFPETWLPGYPVWIDAAPEAALWDHPPARALFRLLRANSPRLDGPEVARLRAAAAEHRVVVVIGMHERLRGSLYNTMLLLGSDGATSRVHRKLVPTYTERLLWGQGDGSTLRTLPTELGAVGGLVCWEHWMPLARSVMHQQDEVLHVAQWPWVREMHLICSRQYAFEGRCWVAASGCVLTRGDVLEGFDSLRSDEAGARELLASIPGDDGALLLRGGSCLIRPDGRLVVEPTLDDAGTLYAEVDPGLIDEELMTLDTAGHYSRPDVFRLEVDTTARLETAPLEAPAPRGGQGKGCR